MKSPTRCLLILAWLLMACLLTACRDAVADDTVADGIRELWIQRYGLTEAAAPIDFDPARKQLLANCRRCAVLWDVETGLALRQYALSSSIVALRFHGDNGVLLATAHSLTLFDRESGQVARAFDLQSASIHCVAVASNGRLIAAADTSGHVSVWNAENGARLHRLDARRHVLALAFSPDNRLLLAGGDDGVGILWDLDQAKVLHRFRAATDIRKAGFSSDGQRLVTAGSGGYWYTPRVVVWDIATMRPLQVIPRVAADAYFVGEQLALTLPDGASELWAADRHEAPPDPKDWPTYDSTPKQRWLVAPNHWVLHVRSEQPSATLTAPAPDTQVLEWPAETPFFPPRDHHPVAFSPDGQWLVTGGARYSPFNARGALFDLSAGQLKRWLPPGNIAAFHPAGKLLAWGGQQELSLIEIGSGKTQRTIRLAPAGRAGILTDAQFTPDGRSLLTATGDWYDGDGGSLELWDADSGERLRSYFESDKAVMHAGFTSSGEHIVAALTPGEAGSAGVDQLTVLETKSGHHLHSRTFGHRDLGAVKLAPAARVAAAAVWRGAEAVDGGPGTYLFDIRDFSGKRLSAGQPASFTSDGQVLANFRERGLLGFWNVPERRLVHLQYTPLQPSGPVLFHPGQLLIAGPTFDILLPHGPAGRSVGLQQVPTGELEAELLLWEPEAWLIATRSGHLSGSRAGLARVTWREPGTTRVEQDMPRTQTRVDPARVSQSLSQSLQAERKLVEVLDELPDPEIEIKEEPPERNAGGGPWFRDYTPLRNRAVEAMREAGAELRIDKFRGATFVHLEQRTITDELLAQLRWAGAVDRLYLAKTGITDAQLDIVGLQGSVKRLSLWENPVTDRGLLELTGLWNLEVLDVHDTEVTAAGLNALRLLPKLKTLIVPEGINPIDLAPLKERHPQLEIIPRD